MSQPAGAAGRIDRDARHATNLERLIADLYEVHDLGAVRLFEHFTEPSRDGQRTMDMFRVTFPAARTDRSDRQAVMTYSQVRAWLQGFFAGRDYPRPARVADVATIRHVEH